MKNHDSMFSILNNGFTFEHCGKNWDIHMEKGYTLPNFDEYIMLY